MRLKNLVVKGFRCFDPDGVAYRPGVGLNTLLGENNAGKSSLFQAFAYIQQALEGSAISFRDSDFWKRQRIHEIAMSGEFRLEGDEADPLLGALTAEVSRRFAPGPSCDAALKSVKENLCTSLIAEVRFPPGVSNALISLRTGPFQFAGANAIAAAKNSQNFGGNNRPWADIVATWASHPTNSLDDVLGLVYRDTPETLIILPINLQRHFAGLLQSSYKLIPEVRQRPAGGTQNVIEALTGTETASALQTLKNSDDPDQIARYDEIRQRFRSIFPAWDLDSVTGPAITIVATDSKLRIPHNQIGMGVAEVITMLVNLVNRQGLMFVIEEPELHLHPHMQRELARTIVQHSSENQIFVITHSSQFLNTEELGANTVFRQTDNSSRLYSIDSTKLNAEQKMKLKVELDDADGRDLFFSRAVVFVEGSTERGALPELVRKLPPGNESFDKHGITIYELTSKDNWKLYVEIAEQIGLKWTVLTDRDAIMEAARTAQLAGAKVQTSSVFFQLAESGRLDTALFAELQKLAPRILQVPSRRKPGTMVPQYPDDLFPRLREMARSRGIVVLSETFEQVLRSGANQPLFDQAEREVGNSKPRQGRYVAENMPVERIPPEIQEVIQHVLHLSQ